MVEGVKLVFSDNLQGNKFVSQAHVGILRWGHGGVEVEILDVPYHVFGVWGGYHALM